MRYNKILKNKRLFVFALICITTISFAQEKVILESEPRPCGKEVLTEFFGIDDVAVYSLGVDNKGKGHLNIEKRDKTSLKVIFSKNIIDENGVGMSNFNYRCFLIKNKVYCFYHYFDAGIMYVMLQTITSTGEVSVVYNVLKVETSDFNSTSAMILFTPDKEKFFVCPNPEGTYAYLFSENSKYKGTLLSKFYKTENLELIWEKDISASLNGMSRMVSDVTIDNVGNLYFLLKQREESCVFCLIEPNSPTIKTFPDLLPANKKYEGASVKIARDGNILFTGVYADKNKDSKGFFNEPVLFLRIINSQDKSIILNEDYSFDSNIMNKLSIGRIDKGVVGDEIKKKGEPYNLFSDPVIHESENNFYLIMQDIFKDAEGLVLQYKDLVVAKISKTGKLNCMANVPCYNVPTMYNVFIKNESFLINDKLYLLFAETEEYGNIDINEYETAILPPTKGLHYNNVLVKLDDKNALSKKILFVNAKKEYLYRPYGQRVLLFEPDKLIILLENTKSNFFKHSVYKIE